jgi:hypothetical protein
MLVGEAVSLAVDAVLPLIDVGLLPWLCFIDPIVKDDSELPPTESPAGVHTVEETEDDDPLMAVGACLGQGGLGKPRPKAGRVSRLELVWSRVGHQAEKK